MSGIGIGISASFLEHLSAIDEIVIVPPVGPPEIEVNTLSLTLPVPNNTKNGDTLVALISTDGNPVITPPVGWVAEDSIGGTAKSFVYYRSSPGGEPANYTWTLGGAEDAIGQILLIKRVHPTDPINVKVTDSGNGSTIAVPAITTTTDKTMLLTLISLNDGILIDVSTLKKAKQVSLWVVNSSGAAIGSVGSSAAYKTLKKAGVHAAYNLQTQGLVVTDYYSIQIAFNPASYDPPPVPPVPLYEDYIYLYDKKGVGVAGGNSVSGAWRTRDLTDEVEDTGNLCTLAANQFTLDTGTYRCLISAPALRSDQHQSRLYNITDGAMELLGTSCWNNSGSFEATTHSFIRGKFTIAAQKTFEVQHRVQSSQAGNGWGGPSSWSDGIFTTVELWKEA